MLAVILGVQLHSVSATWVVRLFSSTIYVVFTWSTSCAACSLMTSVVWCCKRLYSIDNAPFFSCLMCKTAWAAVYKMALSEETPSAGVRQIFGQFSVVSSESATGKYCSVSISWFGSSYFKKNVRNLILDVSVIVTQQKLAHSTNNEGKVWRNTTLSVDDLYDELH